MARGEGRFVRTNDNPSVFLFEHPELLRMCRLPANRPSQADILGADKSYPAA